MYHIFNRNTLITKKFIKLTTKKIITHTRYQPPKLKSNSTNHRHTEFTKLWSSHQTKLQFFSFTPHPNQPQQITRNLTSNPIHHTKLILKYNDTKTLWSHTIAHLHQENATVGPEIRKRSHFYPLLRLKKYTQNKFTTPWSPKTKSPLIKKTLKFIIVQ